MKFGSSKNKELRLRWSMPGRERWEVARLHRNPLLAIEMETRLRRYSRISQVAANAETGRILVLFPPTLIKSRHIKRYIEKALEEALQCIAPQPLPAETSERTSADPLQRRMGKVFDKQLVDIVATGNGVSVKALRKPLSLSTANAVLTVLSPIALSLLVATPISGGLPFLATLGLRSKLAQFIFLGGSYLGLKTMDSYVSYLTNKNWGEYSQERERALRMKVFEKIQSMDTAYLENEPPEKLMALINNDIDKISAFLSEAPPTVWRKWLTIGIGTAILGLVSPLVLLLTLIPAPYLYYLEKRHFTEAGKNFGKVAMDKDAQNQILAGNFNGSATVKSFASEPREYRRLSDNSDQLYASRVEALRENAGFYAKNNYAFMMGISVPLVYASYGLMIGRFTFTEVMIQMSMAPTMMESSSGHNLINYQYQEAKQAAKRLDALLHVSPGILDGPYVLERGAVRGDLSFEAVTFGYGESPVLEDFSLSIPANRTIALVGGTGSGKSTIVKLLQRFYDVDQGRILVDGNDVRDFRLDNLRNLVGVVSQDVFLFNGTIYENVHYGRPDADREEVLEACRVAEMLEFVEAQPAGFDTVVGDRGQKLSGGQRQRISIARTILKNPPILILDEATSSVDNKTEAAIQRSVNRLSENRTTIIIAHRLSTVRHADRIYFLKDGELHEEGTHENLLDLNGEYAQLWHLQASHEPSDPFEETGVGRG
ncbi:ABC transporter ATP-binding protein [Sulfidibacter corallicola]|uniref:ABC transporter ATP-binding protein n=1 Tax=Sulfidibacter corallicola TaxID=2818388 RepID=A0A8A4TWA7_SULCO|nr:ABC transporter ATP-binding protein [Sulfidibacter corallicola]QTD53414.1 ABC transporter ATP-binding protein [Sulfidibacter corallicola]